MEPQNTLPALSLVRGAFASGLAALRRIWGWAALFVIAAMLLGALGPPVPEVARLGALVLLFLTGVGFSEAQYRAMNAAPPSDRRGSVLALLQTNLLLYLAFSFIGVFAGFFVLILAGILLQQSTGSDLENAKPEDVQALFTAMLQTPFGFVLILVALGALGALVFVALRLVTCGAATVDRGKVQVFSTWGLTRGSVIKLGLATLATHALPFLIACVVWSVASRALPEFLRSGLTAFALVPFFAAGQGLAHTAYQRLKS